MPGIDGRMAGVILERFCAECWGVLMRRHDVLAPALRPATCKERSAVAERVAHVPDSQEGVWCVRR